MVGDWANAAETWGRYPLSIALLPQQSLISNLLTTTA